jgi:hypothetical protein
MTARSTGPTPHNSPNSNPNAAIACVARLDLRGSSSATPRAARYSAGAGRHHLRKVQR